VTKTKVFVSYDFDNDKILYDIIISQAKLPDSPFAVSDHSLKEAAPERNWEMKARAAISRADKFIVMLGLEDAKNARSEEGGRDGQGFEQAEVSDHSIPRRFSGLGSP